MTIEATGNAPAVPPGSINEALVALQARLPHVTKTELSQAGERKYLYADLASVTYALLPVMTDLGLSFTSLPTLMWNDDHPEIPPRFVLDYTLRHASGEYIQGFYPLPSGVGPQAMGGAITYARRYTLCAVTGLAPDEDDDAAAAEAGLRQQAQQARQAQPANGRLRSASQEDKPAAPDPRPAQAQELADLAVVIATSPRGTVEDLHEQVYKPASSKRMLRAPVIDPVTGEKTQLTTVVGAAKARLESASAEAAS